MTTCSTVHIDSTPHRSAVVARCASSAGLLNGPELTNISPSFIGRFPRCAMRRSKLVRAHSNAAGTRMKSGLSRLIHGTRADSFERLKGSTEPSSNLQARKRDSKACGSNYSIVRVLGQRLARLFRAGVFVEQLLCSCDFQVSLFRISIPFPLSAT